MKIDKLELENFRGACNLSLELDAHLNVFVGMNGTGKSSILDAAAILLSWPMNRIKQLQISGRRITENDIRNGADSARLRLKSSDQEENIFEWGTSKTKKGHRRKTFIISPLSGATNLAKSFQTAITEKNEQVNIPLFVYYPVNRAVLDIPLRIRRKHSFALLSAYDNALTSGANFRTFFEWFREREDLENEARRDLSHQSSLVQLTLEYTDPPPETSGSTIAQLPDPQLEAVRKALGIFMPDFTNLTVRRKPLRMEVDKEKGGRLTVNQLSDGEKCLMAMVGDLARRMAIANPMRENPLHGDGIILIDEIDLHLHPKWQQMIIPKLREVFPNCQFLISTHSPHVMTHVPPESLFLLDMTSDGIKYLPVSESYGKTAERILEDLMGLETTRPKKIQEELDKIYDDIDSGNLKTAQKSIKKLEKEIGSDPDLVKANVLIRRKELIGK